MKQMRSSNGQITIQKANIKMNQSKQANQKTFTQQISQNLKNNATQSTAQIVRLKKAENRQSCNPVPIKSSSVDALKSDEKSQPTDLPKVSSHLMTSK